MLHLIWGFFHSIQGLFHFIGKPMEEGDVRRIEWERDLGCKSVVTIQLAEGHATYVLHHATCISCIPVCVCMCVSIKMLQPCIEYIQAREAMMLFAEHQGCKQAKHCLSREARSRFQQHGSIVHACVHVRTCASMAMHECIHVCICLCAKIASSPNLAS